MKLVKMILPFAHLQDGDALGAFPRQRWKKAIIITIPHISLFLYFLLNKNHEQAHGKSNITGKGQIIWRLLTIILPIWNVQLVTN